MPSIPSNSKTCHGACGDGFDCVDGSDNGDGSGQQPVNHPEFGGC